MQRLKSLICDNVFTLSVFAFLFSFGAFYIRLDYLATDDWFILATGRYIIENGFPMENPFVIHEGFSIVIQQWLFDVVVYEVYRIASYFGMYILAFFLFAVFCILFYRLCALWTKNITLQAICLLSGGCIFLMMWSLRPTSVTASIVTLEMIVLEKWRKSMRHRTLLWLVPLAWFEVNVHAAFFPILFVLMLPYVMPEDVSGFSFSKTGFFKFFKSLNFSVLAVMPFMAVVGLINPYGLRGALYLFLSYGAATSITIVELQPVFFASGNDLIIIAEIVVIALYLYKLKSGINFARTCMALGTVVLACIHMRNLWFPVFGVLPLLDSVVPDLRPFSRRTGMELAAAVLCGGIYFGYQAMEIPVYTESSETGAAAADYLDSVEDDVVLFTDFNYGAYMEWRGYRVYIDNRPELFGVLINGKEDVASEFEEITSENADFPSFLGKYGFNYLLVRNNTAIDVYLSAVDDEYEKVVCEEGCTLYHLISSG